MLTPPRHLIPPLEFPGSTARIRSTSGFMMANRDLLKTFPCFFIAGIFASFLTTPLICKSFDLRNDHENQCSIYNRLQKLKVSPPGGCLYDEVMDLAFKLMLIGAIFLILVIFVLCCMWILIKCSSKYHITGILSVFLVGTLILVGFMTFYFITYDHIQRKDEELNWKTLYTDMESSLVKNFLSDNIRSANETSNQWNILFIEYKCCAVKRIYGTTNDFDTTPWCTTNGSCQQTNSQIPKSCCLGVTEEDLQSADVKCHATVSPQTYNDKGCFLAVKKELIEKRTQHKLKIREILEEGIKVFSTMGICVLLQIFCIAGNFCDVSKEESERRNHTTGESTQESTHTNGTVTTPL